MANFPIAQYLVSDLKCYIDNEDKQTNNTNITQYWYKFFDNDKVLVI